MAAMQEEQQAKLLDLLSADPAEDLIWSWNMCSLQRFCWTVTNRAGQAGFAAPAGCVCACVCVGVSFCLCAVTHVHMQHLNRQEPVGGAPGRQVRHAARTGRILEGPGLSESRGPSSASVRQLPSACRGSGVYSSSLLLLGSPWGPPRGG